MPTPPKESIKGKSPHQIQAFEFSKQEYTYLVQQIAFRDSPDFLQLDEFEQNQIKNEIDSREITYENLITRVNRY